LFNSNENKRGFYNYLKIITKEIFSYKEKTYTIKTENHEYTVSAFMICAANSSQFGNNFFIAPDADICDSKLNICIVEKFPKYKIPLITLMAVFKKISSSRHYKCILAGKAQIITNEKNLIHIDGEPIMAGEVLNMQVIPSSLNVIV
jgi:diacylglycerol kinase family enzyme